MTFSSSGSHFEAGSSSESLPSSTSNITAVAFTDLVIEAIQKSASFSMARPLLTSAIPAVS